MSKKVTKKRKRKRKLESKVSDSDEDVRSRKGSLGRSGGFGKGNSSTSYRDTLTWSKRRQQIQELKEKLAESQRKRERLEDLRRSERDAWKPAGR